MHMFIIPLLMVLLAFLGLHTGEAIILEKEVKPLQERVLNLTKYLTEKDEMIDYLLWNESVREMTTQKIYSNMNKQDFTLATITERASKAYSIDPLLLTALINSESSFVLGVKHNDENVKGLGGINHKWWKIPNNTPTEQIFATAFVLKYYLDKHKDIVEALTSYKGRSALGKRQANYVYGLYQQYTKDNNVTKHKSYTR